MNASYHDSVREEATGSVGHPQGGHCAPGVAAGRRDEEVGAGQSLAVLGHPRGHIERHQGLHNDSLTLVLVVEGAGKVVEKTLKVSKHSVVSSNKW